jgi:flagellar hook protein FlgE
VGDARIPAGSIPPRATRHIRLAFALDADAPIESEPFDEFDPSGTSQERIALEAFDEVGRAQTLLLYLARVSERDWRWTLALDRTGAEDGLAHAGFPDVPGDDEEEEAVVAAASLPELVVGPPLNGVFSNAPIPLVDVLEDGTGWLRFDESGELLAIAQGDVWLTPNRLPTIAIGETRPDSSTGWIAVDLGYGRTHLAGAFSLTALEQDGYGPGVITSVHVSGYHVLQVVGSNGVTLPAAVLAFALPGQPECRFVCRNEVDDDRDGLVDYPDDPGCASGFDGTE